MTDSLKDRLKSDLDSIKTAGGTRTTRIRDILQSAASQSVAELKQGVGEIRATASQSASTIAQTLSSTETPEEPTFATVLKGIRTRFMVQVKRQFVNLDAKLTTQYGNRYETVKQRFGLFRVWYKNSRANAEAIGIDPVQQKQAEIELKIADQGAFVARKEQQIRQQVKELFTDAIAKR